MTGFKVGDIGQRYEVRYKDNTGKIAVCGWGETDDEVAGLVRGIELHPCFHSPEVIDRQALKEKGGK